MTKLLGVCLTVLTILLSISALGDERIVGVGMVLELKDKVIYVKDLVSGAPAERAGVKRGEIVKSVDGVATLEQSLDFVVARIRGEVGKPVTIVFGDDAGHERSITMIRELINYATCFIEGSYNLRSNGFNNNPPTSISGSIGDAFVNLFVSGSFVSGNINNESVTLNYSSFGNQETLSGWIHQNFVSWSGNNGTFFGYQPCIE
jgi:hypothetical protein